jgi:hypothetical protein
MNIILLKTLSRKIWFWELLVVIALILFLSSCSSSPQAAELPSTTEAPAETLPPTQPPTSTPKPTATPLPTSTPTPQPTDTPAPTATSTPDLQATAAAEATQRANEALAGIKSEIEAIGYAVDNGELGWLQDESVEILADEYMVTMFEPFGDELVANDFILKTEITWESTSGLAGCGLIFHSEPNFKKGAQYELAFLRLSGLPIWFIAYADDGEYQKDITGALTAGAIDQEQGSTNTYMLIAEEGKYTMYINDLRVGSYYDYAINRSNGQFAFTGWQESGETTCEFNKTWVWLLE